MWWENSPCWLPFHATMTYSVPLVWEGVKTGENHVTTDYVRVIGVKGSVLWTCLWQLNATELVGISESPHTIRLFRFAVSFHSETFLSIKDLCFCTMQGRTPAYLRTARFYNLDCSFEHLLPFRQEWDGPAPFQVFFSVAFKGQSASYVGREFSNHLDFVFKFVWWGELQLPRPRSSFVRMGALLYFPWNFSRKTEDY